jgi:probable F420-dependent oxidoreductase
VKFTAAIPLGRIDGGFQSMAAIGEMTTTLEQAGLDACYVTDHPAPDAQWLHAHGHDALDPFTALAFVAAASSTLGVHTNIVVLPYRNPFLTAKAAATLHVLSGGRLILGVAPGYQVGEFEALGVDFHRRGALTEEALQVIRQAWAGGAVTWQGTTFEARGNEPRPALPSPPPIWIGGGSATSIERAARYGDGWSPFLAAPTLSATNRASAIGSVQQLGDKIEQLHQRRHELGQDGPFDIAFELGGQLHPRDRSRAEQQRFLELLAELAAVGVTWTCLTPADQDHARYVESVQWYGEEIIGQARSL